MAELADLKFVGGGADQAAAARARRRKTCALISLPFVFDPAEAPDRREEAWTGPVARGFQRRNRLVTIIDCACNCLATAVEEPSCRTSRSRAAATTEGLAAGSTPLVRFAGLTFDLAACTLTTTSGEPIPLTRGEFALLRLFVSRPGRALSRDTILNAIADRPLEPFDRSIDVLVSRLRRKIEPDPRRRASS